MTPLETEPFALEIPGINVLSVFDIGDDCKIKPVKGRRHVLLYAEVKAVTWVYLIYLDKTIYPPYKYLITSYFEFKLGELDELCSSPHSTINNWAKDYGLTTEQLSELIEKNAPK